MYVQNNLQKFRKTRNLTQEQLGEYCGATKGQISKLENGSQPWTEEWLKKIENAFKQSGWLEFEAWWLLKDPSEISVRVEQEDIEFVKNFKNAPKHVQMTIEEMLKVYAEE